MRLRKLIFILIISPVFVFCSHDSEPNSAINNAPLSFELKKVGNNQTEVSLKPKLSWNAAEDPDNDEVKYSVYLNLKNEDLKLIASNLTSNEFQIENKLDLISEYSWKVIATDPRGAETSSDISNFTTRNFLDAQLIKESPFPSRITHSVSLFNDKIWVAGGQKPESESSYGDWKRNDVWFSENGIDWIEKENLPIPMESHDSKAFSEKLWVIGSKVFSTTDGNEWNSVNTNESLPSLQIPKIEVFNKKMWILNVGSPYSIWNSNDGQNWTKVQGGLDFLSYDCRMIQFNDQLLIISRTDPISVRVIKEDGTINELPQNNELPRYISEFVVYENKMWAFGKSFVNGNETLFQIWNSEDAMTWKLVKEDPNLDVYGPMVLLNDKFYFIASRWATNTSLRDFTSEIWMIE